MHTHSERCRPRCPWCADKQVVFSLPNVWCYFLCLWSDGAEAVRGDGEMCNELGGSLWGCRRGLLPHTSNLEFHLQASWAPASVALELGAGGAALRARAGGCLCGQRPRWTGQEGPPPHCEKLPSCNALSFRDGGSGGAPGPCSAPSGPAVTDGNGAVLRPPALPARTRFLLGRPQQSPPGRHETTC